MLRHSTGMMFLLIAVAVTAQPEDTSVVTADGLIHAQRPAGEGWECLQSRQKQDDSTVTMVKCRRSSDTEFFFLQAKDYTYPKSQSKSPEDFSNKIFKKTYQQIYTSVKYLSSVKVLHQGQPAWDVRFDASHDRMGELRKFERVLVRGEHVLVLSAEGSRGLFESMQTSIDAWFETVEFLSLKPQDSKPK